MKITDLSYKNIEKGLQLFLENGYNFKDINNS